MILSIDTSTPICSVALHQTNGELLGVSELHIDKSHSASLAVLVDELVRNTGTTLQDLKAVAVSMGPGSYTGLRIGTATAKGYCYTLDIPMIAVSTLAAMAQNVKRFVMEGKALICPMLDARRMEVYTAFYNKDLEMVKEVHPKVIDETSFQEELADSPIYFFGNGAPKSVEVIQHENVRFVDGIYPSAKYIGELACQKFEKEEFVDVAYFEPFYLKEFRMSPSKKNPLGLNKKKA
ncbi:tRNA (adenosine(37)-N6)-threonylcarbamoyltransferase complex dimerization subunit type 1 TsaB [Sediminitomix flava]|uniref:tRNA threonylcarbamoyladenosine biosynthesis protein TsaB n=1 Tax=Sediminitomix flava TaxID=379075 RepID=A0A315ZG11_SEDFL|nr:tRNA (adenosine(37)-N6)-threonylcarbamoyltransferase complex dimerization subunit type 1 TsaB [Sediminitomix flava]PWJ44526.1 tRNA threonylcarbamoyladenosine biosynthesis protein TsaB [Sediminitomix flava]